MNDSSTALAANSECGSPDIRRWFPKPSHRAECFVCGKWRELTHWHHAPPISSAGRVLFAYELMDFEWPMFALCPTHHAVIHVFERGDERRAASVMGEMTEDECKRIDEILDAERLAWEGLYERSAG